MLYIAAAPCGEDKDSQRTVARGLLKEMLSAVCPDIATENIRCAENGKPYLEGDSVYFSLSHTGGAVCCVVSAEGDKDIKGALSEGTLLFSENAGKMPVGADIECSAVLRDFERIANGIFTEDEKAYFSQSDKKADAFYYIYTRKESVVKASGEGISALRSIASVLPPNNNLYTYRVSFFGKPYVMSVAFEKAEEGNGIDK